MDTAETLDRICRLLDSDDISTVNTSMRLPGVLRDAAMLAVDHLGASLSTTTLTAAALRSALETLVVDAALDDHFERHPSARPSLVDIALALAEQDGSPIAGRRDLIERAVAEITRRHPNADADDVLLWVEAQQVLSA